VLNLRNGDGIEGGERAKDEGSRGSRADDLWDGNRGTGNGAERQTEGR
jgi:hypothetical protein